MKSIILITNLFWVSYVSVADVPFAFSDVGWESSEKKIIDESYLLLSSIVIGTTTLDEVIHIFGQSDIYRPSNKKNYSPNLLCYRSMFDDASVIFQSGPLGGWEVVTAIWIGRIDLIDEKRCAKSKSVNRKEMTMNGLSLSLNANEIKSLLGEPTFDNSSFFAYRYADKTVLKGKIFDVSSGLEFEFSASNKLVNWFRIYQQFSY